jgi:hypothetical protein
MIADINVKDETLSFNGSGSYYVEFNNSRVVAGLLMDGNINKI